MTRRAIMPPEFLLRVNLLLLVLLRFSSHDKAVQKEDEPPRASPALHRPHAERCG